MASRDTSNFRTVINTVTKNPNQFMAATAEIGADIIRQGQESKINENISKAQLDLSALQTQYQIDFETNPMGGMEDYKQRRQEIFDNYGSDISPLFGRSWQDSVKKIELTNDATQQGWAYKQTRINTVRSINDSMKNNFKQANMDGQNFGNSDETEVGAYVNFELSQGQLTDWGNRNLGAGTTADMLDGYDKDYMKSFISGVADSNPQKAEALMADPKIKEMFSSDEVDSFEDVIRKSSKRKEIGSLFDQMGNESQVADIVNDPEGDYFSKRLKIDHLAMSGKISETSATRARRVLTSQKNVDSITDPEIMGDMVQSIYDLNELSDLSNEDYMKGVRNIRNDIMDLQAAGEINPRDAQKLNRQLTTLSGKKLAEATQTASMGFSENAKKFEQLAPQYRGKAVRELFYQTEGQDLTPEQITKKANKIVDDINLGIRSNTVERLKKLKTPDADFLKSKGYTAEDVKETADIYGITEEEVIQKLKAK